ncbi:DUF4433 domain-containing protein [Hyphomonas sp.]|uniref:type II toxin-antitoxin system toxin DNA ADP-ribosyl transferase DarT n=1 Tax=Hyphomonas sp. TaxID=87 RepID=UPI0032D8C011
MSRDLTPDKARIFRIAHIDNVEMILRDGMKCRNSGSSEDYKQIGNPELIDRRLHREVPCDPGGTLGDYVPFYFTPYSPMLYNISTGYGVQRRENHEIVIFVSSLYKLAENGVPFVFTDRHAYLAYAEFTSDLNRLNDIDWVTLQNRDFTRSDPSRFERYQAEALVHREVPVEALLGVATYNDAVKERVTAFAAVYGVELKVIAKASWYF